MDFVADRFVVRAGTTVDLATGDSVAFIVSTGGGPPEHARWAARCARLSALRHPALAVLVDYGGLGEVRRFEAWGCDGPRRGDTSTAVPTYTKAARFLRLNGLTAGSPANAIVSVDGRDVYLPSPDAGYESDAIIADTGACAPEPIGIEILPRGAVAALAERFGTIAPQGSRVFSLWGPPGSGMDTALLDVARHARAQGIVPVTPASLDRDAYALLGTRSLLILATGSAEQGWRAFLDVSLRSRRPHVLLLVGDHDVSNAQSLVLERFSENALVCAVRPERMRESERERLAALAHRAQGWPARFAQIVLGDLRQKHPPARTPRAAERAVPYGVDASGDRAGGAEPTPWPVAGELVALRDRQRAAEAQFGAGRHARAERELRRAAGGLARRGDWTHAAQGFLALARALVVRGRPREALAAIEEVRRAQARTGPIRLSLAAAALAGRAALDLLQLDEAESVLEAALSTAVGLSDAQGRQCLSLELSRCLFWRGRYQSAAAVLSAFDTVDAGSDETVMLAIARSRAALGQGDLPEAVTHAAAAVAAAQLAHRPDLVAAALSAAALVHLAVGDAQAVQREFDAGLRAAHQAHAPLVALRIRLIAAESQRRQGRRSPVARLVARMHRDGRSRLPPILAARVALLADLLKDDRPEVAVRHANATGLAALTLFAPARRASVAVRTMASDLVEIVRCCQQADDDAHVLTVLSTRLRAALQASAVAFLVEDRGQLVTVAFDGGRIDQASAERVSAIGDTLGPREGVGGTDGGMAVRYGGQLLGVLAVRWAGPRTRDGLDCVSLLSTAAAVAGPALAAERARRAQPTSVGAELLGTSTAMEHVRHAIERAAPAPFAVLVEGESGTGKELVARALHKRSPRRDRARCTVNCAALPDDLVESELFGHARGAFTGAMAERPGVFEEAHGGTLFLDEIGELSLRAQAKVLRAIQEGEIRRVGENVARRVDARIVAATNRNLHHEAAVGRFRLDLLYRLDVIRIAVPSLRDRVEDIPLLAEHFWREAVARVGGHATLGVATIAALARYDWPGNVRELQNVLASLAVRCPRRGVVPPSALPPIFDGARAGPTWRLEEARRTFEASFVRAALARAGGHRTRAAEELGVTRQGLTKLIARLGLAPAHARPPAND